MSAGAAIRATEPRTSVRGHPHLARRAAIKLRTHNPTNTKQATAITTCETTAAGRSAAPLSKAGTPANPRADPKNPSKPTIAAPCMACFRKFSLRAKYPNTANNSPKAAGISAVGLCCPVATQPPSPSAINSPPKVIVVAAMPSS